MFGKSLIIRFADALEAKAASEEQASQASRTSNDPDIRAGAFFQATAAYVLRIVVTTIREVADE